MFGNYTYQTFFDLTGYDATQLRLVGQWAVDNSGTDILVNGISTGNTSPGFGGFTPFTISSGLQAGLNQLDFQMNNAGTTTNPTGMRIDLELQATIQATMTISRSPTSVSLNWTPVSPCQKLYCAPTVVGPWNPINSAQGNYSVNLSDPNAPPEKFFKIIEQ